MWLKITKIGRDREINIDISNKCSYSSVCNLNPILRMSHYENCHKDF